MQLINGQVKVYTGIYIAQNGQSWKEQEHSHFNSMSEKWELI